MFDLSFKDLVDILLVALLMHQLYKLLRRSGAVNVFFGVLAFLICWILVSFVFEMELLGTIFDRVASVGAFALIVLFQNEIRRFFSRIGSHHKWNLKVMIQKLFDADASSKKNVDIHLIQIVLACRALSKSSTGGLIVIERNFNLSDYSQSGEQINATISSRLIENIFFKNSPLHDGAMIITDKTIRAAACILPISKNQTIPRRLGLRHRAALGISEISDAIGIVVSEETGHVSYAINGQLTTHVKPEELEHMLCEEMMLKK